jgi:hypothetical protein
MGLWDVFVMSGPVVWSVEGVDFVQVYVVDNFFRQKLLGFVFWKVPSDDPAQILIVDVFDNVIRQNIILVE